MKRRCSHGGHLVDARGLIPRDPADWMCPGAPLRGCNRLHCSACGADVRQIPERAAREDLRPWLGQPITEDSPFLVEQYGVRLYFCDCTAWLEHLHTALRDEEPPDVLDIVPPRSWACAGHPVGMLPARLDGVGYTELSEVLGDFCDSLEGHPPEGAPERYRDWPGLWALRLYGYFEAPEMIVALRPRLALATTLDFIQTYPLRELEDALPGVLAQDRGWEAAVALHRAHGSVVLRDAFRDRLLSPGAPAAVLDHAAAVDLQWTANNFGDIIQANPVLWREPLERWERERRFKLVRALAMDLLERAAVPREELREWASSIFRGALGPELLRALEAQESPFDLADLEADLAGRIGAGTLGRDLAFEIGRRLVLLAPSRVFDVALALIPAPMEARRGFVDGVAAGAPALAETQGEVLAMLLGIGET